MRTERKLLNIGAYLQESGIQETALVTDIGATATETSQNLPYWERVHFFALTSLGPDWIIDATRGDADISTFYSDKTKHDKREKETGVRLAQTLYNYPEGSIAIHVSPQGGALNYEEGRIQVAFNRRSEGIHFAESYGIPSPFDIQGHEYLGIRLSEYADVPQPKDPEELRDTVFVLTLPENVNPWEFMKGILPLENVWENIQSGEYIAETFRRREIAKEAADYAKKTVPTIRTERDQIAYGAAAESYMNNNGFAISGSNCGASNTELLGMLYNQSGYSYQSLYYGYSPIIDLYPRTSKETKIVYKDGRYIEVLSCECPFCCQKVDAEIYDGKIHCTNPDCKKGLAGVPWEKQFSYSLN